MVDWLKKHWCAFWRSGPENHYTFIWWTIDVAIVAAVASLLAMIASHLGWLFPALETTFSYFFMAFAASAFLAWLVQSLAKRFGMLVVEPTSPETEAQITETAKVTASSEIQDEPLHTEVAELPRESNLQLPEQAIRYFNDFNPNRSMTDLSEREWRALGTLFSVQIQNGVVNDKPWERRYLMLRYLPDSNPVDAYSLLLLLYGYWRIYDFADVAAAWLEQSLYLSGLRQETPFANFLLWPQARRLNVDSVAQVYILDGLISKKFGLAKGGFYKLTDAGAKKAQAMFVDLVERA